MAAASKEAPTVGTEITKQLKELVKEVVENDEEIRGLVKGMVLNFLRSNPSAVQRSFGHVIDEALNNRWSQEKSTLQIEVKKGVDQVLEAVLANVRQTAVAELERQVGLLKVC